MASKGYIRTEKDMKLIVLYILAKVHDALTLDVLLYAVMTDPAAQCLPIIECIEDMVSTEHIRALSDGGETHYCISPLGMQTLQACLDEIRPSVRSKALLAASIARRQFQYGSGVKTSTVKLDEKKYQTTLSLSDGDDILMEIKMLCVDEDQGTVLENNFRRGQSKLYNRILADLLDDYCEPRDTLIKK